MATVPSPLNQAMLRLLREQEQALRSAGWAGEASEFGR
jgi:hypothetical protein